MCEFVSVCVCVGVCMRVGMCKYICLDIESTDIFSLLLCHVCLCVFFTATLHVQEVHLYVYEYTA